MTAINAVVDLRHEGDVAVVTINSPPVNALSAVVREGLKGAFDAAIADLLTYLRRSWGHEASAVSELQVLRAR